MVQWLKKNVAGILCVILALAAGGVTGYVLADGEREQLPMTQLPQERIKAPLQQENSPEEEPEEGHRIYVFSKCGHTLQLQEKDGPIADHGQSQTQAAYPNITIQTMNGEDGGLLYEVASHCPAHYVLILTSEGVLQVQQTNADTLAVETVMTLSLDVSVLSRQVQDALQEGMVFDSLEQINKYLEDVES